MDITKENIDELNAVLKVKIGPQDYNNQVESALKNYQKKVQMPGFRPGKVPVGLVKKMYGKSILVDELNRIISDSLHKYITDNQIEVLGNPLPKATNDGIDWDNQKDFEFLYELGLAPQFSVELSNKDKFVYELVKIEPSLTEKYVNDIAKRYGKVTYPETSEGSDLLMGDFVELDAAGGILAGGIFKSSSLALDRVKDETEKAKLIGIKKEDKVTVDVKKLSDNLTDVAAMLGIDKAKAAELTSSFQFTVKNIGRVMPSELNQELFDKVYGPGAVTTEEEFRNKINEELRGMYAGDSERKFYNSVVDALMGKVNIKLPDDFLKRWITATNEKPVTLEQVSAEYEGYANGLRWQLIENKIIKDHGVTVTHDEVMEHVRGLILDQARRYGAPELSGDELEKTVKQVLSKEEEVKKIYDRLYGAKVMQLFKQKFTIEEKEVPYDEFFKK